MHARRQDAGAIIQTAAGDRVDATHFALGCVLSFGLVLRRKTGGKSAALHKIEQATAPATVRGRYC